MFVTVLAGDASHVCEIWYAAAVGLEIDMLGRIGGGGEGRRAMNKEERGGQLNHSLQKSMLRKCKREMLSSRIMRLR